MADIETWRTVAITQSIVISIIPIIATDSHTCFGDSSTFTISVFPVPEVSLRHADAVVCPGKTVTLSPNISQLQETQPETFLWNTGATDQNLSFTATESGTYSVTVTFSNGCKASCSAFVGVINMERPVITGDHSICRGETSVLSATTISADYQYKWNDGFVGKTRMVTPSVTTEYVVRGFIPPEEDCFRSDSFTVNVHQLPEASFVFSPDEVVLKDSVGTLYCTLTCSPDSVWYWNFHDRFNPQISDHQNERNPSHTYRHIGQYPVTLYVTDKNNCTDSLTQYIDVTASVHFYVPNAFTPNHDNLNDVFLPVCEGIEMERYLMLIYDRQGRCLFKSTNLYVGWDGRDMNGVVCPMGVYTYYIRYWTLFDHPKGPGQPQLTGSVTLIR
jgi:gliding motility-associated-like protein